MQTFLATLLEQLLNSEVSSSNRNTEVTKLCLYHVGTADRVKWAPNKLSAARRCGYCVSVRTMIMKSVDVISRILGRSVRESI